MTNEFSNAEILNQATADSAKLPALSGLRNPCPFELGVIEENACADLLSVYGDPLRHISILSMAASNGKDH